MAKHDKFTVQQIIAAIKGSGAIKQAIADRLGVHRHTVDHYLSVYPSAMQAFLNEQEAQGDYAESVIFWQLREKEPTGETGSNGVQIMKPTAAAVDMAKWYAPKKMKARGYGENPALNINYSSLTDDQIERILNGEPLDKVLSPENLNSQPKPKKSNASKE